VGAGQSHIGQDRAINMFISLPNPTDRTKELETYLVNKATNILETHVQMTRDLESEKRLLIKNWRKREVGLSLVRDSVVNVIGTIQIMVGKGGSSYPSNRSYRRGTFC
jgi:hypothetical protein